MSVPTLDTVTTAARRAARELAALDTAAKDGALERIAQAIEARAGEILDADALDVAAAADETAAIVD